MSVILSKKPLVEAIFDLRWEVPTLNGTPVDHNYDLLQGHLKNVLRDKFPVHLRLPFGMFPGVNIPHQVQHQFRTSHTEWPLVQLGSGIITINETTGYKPDTFIPLCLNIFQELSNFWKENGHTPKILNVSLRYIDADNVDGKFTDFFNKLGVSISYDKNILNSPHFKTPDAPHFIDLKTEIETISPNGVLGFAISSGLKDDVPAIVWETQLFSNTDQCTEFSADPEKWLNAAHAVCHEFFFKMIDGELREKYK